MITVGENTENIKYKYLFNIEAEGNDMYLMYNSNIVDSYSVVSDTDINAVNSLIEYCLSNDYQKFKITKMEKYGKVVLDANN